MRAAAAAGLLVLCSIAVVAGATSARADVPMVGLLVEFGGPPAAADLNCLERAGASVDRVYSIVPAAAVHAPEAAVPGLRDECGIKRVEADQRVVGLDYRSTHDWGVVRIRGGEAHAAGDTGTGAKVAVVDSGISCEQVELAVSCAYGPTFVDGTTSSDDDNGHGTHVGGTIAAARNDAVAGAVGVAPDATVVAYKVLDENLYGSASDVIAAIDHVWNGGAIRAQVINMSLGFQRGSRTFEAAVNRAYSSGILLVAAAGNGGKCSGRGDSVSYPAKYAAVIAVAATDSSDARACWSSTGPDVELAAPGVAVYATWPEDRPTSARDPQPVCEADVCHYKYGSGTSMSSPHVAGVAALVFATGITDANGAYGTADEVRQRLTATATDLGVTGRDSHYGFGLVDAYAATR